MENLEQPDQPSGEDAAEANASKMLTHEETPWFFEAASKVYRNVHLRYLLYARLAAYSVAATTLAILVHPAMTMVVVALAVAGERDYLHRLSLQHQMILTFQRTMHLGQGLDYLNAEREAHAKRIDDLTKCVYDHIAEAEGMKPSEVTIGT